VEREEKKEPGTGAINSERETPFDPSRRGKERGEAVQNPEQGES